MRGKEVDLTVNMAAEYRNKARNLMAIVEIYERLHSEVIAHAASSARSMTYLRNLFQRFETARLFRWIQNRLYQFL